MTFILAFVLVAISMVAAESPRSPAVARQTAAPYQGRGWRPTGPAFNLPLRAQPQLQEPAASYGPPPSASYGPPEGTTTEEPSTTTEAVTEQAPITEEPQAENVKVDPRTNKPEKLQQQDTQQQQEPQQYYVVLPQAQNYVYQIPQTAQYVVAAPRYEVQKPSFVQAVPAFAKLQEVPQVTKLQLVQAPHSASSSSIFTPYSASIVQIYQ